MSDIVLIAGSPARPARSTAALIELARYLNAFGGSTALIEVSDLPSDALLGAQADHPILREAIEAVNAARAVVVATPVYKAAYSGALKTFLDLLPPETLTGKLVTPLATGGTLAHLLVLEHALKPVLGALGARRFTGGVYLVDSEIPRHQDESGAVRYHFDGDVERRLRRVATEILEGLESLPGTDGAIYPALKYGEQALMLRTSVRGSIWPEPGARFR